MRSVKMAVARAEKVPQAVHDEIRGTVALSSWKMFDETSGRMSILDLSFRRLAPSRSHAYDDEYRPIFIVGSGRSGNTLVRRLLMDSERIYIPPETYVLGDVIKRFDRRMLMRWSDVCESALRAFASSHDYSFFPQTDLDELQKKLKSFKRDQRNCASLLSAIYMEFARSAGSSAKMWGDKTPLNAYHLDGISRVFPNAKYIFTQRNIFDVVYSYLVMGRYETAQEASNRWITANIACEKHLRKRPHEVRKVVYERFVKNPDEELSAIFHFLGFSDVSRSKLLNESGSTILGDEARQHYAGIREPVSAKSVGKGLSLLSKEQISEIVVEVNRYRADLEEFEELWTLANRPTIELFLN